MHPPSLPEREVLIACARSLVETGPAPTAASLRDCDPARLAESGWVHGLLQPLAGLLAERLEVAGWDALTRAAAQRRMRTLRLMGELSEVAGVLSRSGISWLSFKGPVLSAHAYGAPARRDFGDLDVLVRWEDLPTAAAALAEAGFVAESGAPPGPALRRASHHLEMRRDDVLVEVHWRFAQALYGFREDVEPLLRRAEAMTLRGVPIPVISLSDQLLALAIHASKGLWATLEASVLHVLLARRVAPGDWPEVVERAGAWECTEPLRVSAVLGRMLLDAPAPDPLARLLPETEASRRIARRAAALMFQPGYLGRSYLRAQLDLRPGLWARVRFMARALAHAGGVVDRGPLGTMRSTLAGSLRLFRRYRKD